MLLFLATATLVSCSKSDDNGGKKEQTQNKKFNPPAWIQGTWANEDTDDFLKYRFTQDNFCTTVGPSEQCWKELVNMSAPNFEVTLVEKATDQEYKVSITQMGSTINYHFVKISNNTIEDRTGGVLGGIPRLFKRK